MFNLSRSVPTVAMEEDGPDMTKLEKQLTELRSGSKFKPTPRRPFWSLMYLIPDHHNPTGTSISEGEAARRLAIVGCAMRISRPGTATDVAKVERKII